MTIFVNHKYQPDESHSRANPRVKVTCGVGEVPTIGPRKLTLYDGLHALMTPPAVPSLAMSDLGGAESSATSAPTKYRSWMPYLGLREMTSGCGGWAQGTLVLGLLCHDWWPTVDSHRPSVSSTSASSTFPKACNEAPRPTIYIYIYNITPFTHNRNYY